MRIKMKNEKIIGRVIETDTSKNLPSIFFKKAHQLVFSQLRLSSIEHDIFALFLSRLNKEHWQSYLDKKTIESPTYTFTNDVLADWFDVSAQSLFATLYKPSKRLASRSIGITDTGKGNFEFYSLFKKVKYQDGKLVLIPNDLLINEYLCVSQGHAQIPHHSFRKLKKEYAKRLYTLLCRFRDQNTELHYQSITQLHSFFGLVDERGELTKKTYARTNDLISRIIKPSISEIASVEPRLEFLYDENGNYGFTYQRKGRKIDGLKFLYKWKSAVNQEEQVVRKQLSEEISPYALAVDTYYKIDGLDLNAPTLVASVNELNNFCLNISQLKTDSFEIDGGFMSKFAAAMEEAKK